MQWPYRLLVKLTDEEAAHRRELLDAYGHFAQLSILLIPLFIQLSSSLGVIVRWAGRRDVKPTKARLSPSIRARQAKSSLSLIPARIKWGLADEVATAWGTYGQWMFAVFWTFWLLLLVIKDTGDDYLHVTRRFGIVAASQLPLHYALALKSWSPIQWIFRMSAEELNPYHQSLGRIIALLFVCHASLYMNFYVQIGVIGKRIQDRDVILGICAMASFATLVTTSLARVRNVSYRLFFYLHVALSMAVLPIAYFHVSHVRVYVLECVAVYILLIIQRNVDESTMQAKVEGVSGTNLLTISMQLSSSLSRKRLVPGAHVYLGFTKPQEKLRKNPFTIAKVSTEDRQMQLVARSLSGTTALLKEMAGESRPITIEGPYGSSYYFPELDKYDGVLLVAGGVGATFTLPIYRDLLVKSPAQNLRFIWAVKDVKEAQWGLQGLSKEQGLEVYVTGQGSTKSQSRDGSIELEERTGLLAEEVSEDEHVKRGRPSLPRLVDEFFSQTTQGERFAVLVCGPAGMGTALRREVGRWVGKVDVFWHNEQFGW